MQVKAKLRNLHIAPRKVRLVANLVRGLSVEQAEVQLQYLDKRSSTPMLKLIRSAAANAEHNHKLNRSDLFIKSVEVNDGVTLHRWMPRAMGRATPLKKRSSHITLVLDVKEGIKAAARKKKSETAETEPSAKEVSKVDSTTTQSSETKKSPATKAKAAKPKAAAKK